MAPTILGILSPPSRVNGGVFRVVEMSDGMAVVESLTSGGRWIPGGISIGSVAKAPPASADLIARISATPETGT